MNHFPYTFTIILLFTINEQIHSQSLTVPDLEKAFSDLKCIYGTNTAGVCWPKSDCDSLPRGYQGQCTKDGITDATCCPLRDREATDDVMNRYNRKPTQPSLTLFVKNHKPDSSPWSSIRTSVQPQQQNGAARKGPPIWRPPPIKLVVPTESCATHGISPLIIGGLKVPVSLYPWMAALLYMDSGELFCGGSVISPNFILTAAHCVYGRKEEDIVIRLYDTILTRSEDDISRQPFNVLIQKIIVHPSYDGFSVYHDIALLKITPVINDPDVKPICIPNEVYIKIHLNTSSKVDVLGYGSPSMVEDATNELLKASVNISPKEDCEETYRGSSRLPKGVINSLMCAGDIVGKQDACRGDSGGPLVFASRGTWYIVGIVTAGRECGVYYGLYTRVSSYYDWIVNNARS